MNDRTPVIRAVGLTRFYGRTVGIEELDLEIRRGEIFGFLGPNGSGKTTTIRLLLDLIRPTRGQAFLFGVPAGTPSVRRRVGYLPGELSLDGRMTGAETLRFLSALSGLRPVDRSTEARRTLLANRLGLTSRDLARRVREYSRGMKQKIGLLAAFQHRPDLLILDEPTTGLDPLVREVVFQLMAETREEGATVFHSSHVLSEVDRTCDRVGVLRGGRLATVLSVHESRQASTRRMEVEFRDSPPVEALTAAGAAVERRSGNRLELLVPGEIQPILVILARHPVLHLTFPEPSLEEAFNRYYEDGEEAPPGPGFHKPDGLENPP
ncbi:MAG: ABC transporter ATP-binding protein [Longimicrobiales bacterium]